MRAARAHGGYAFLFISLRDKHSGAAPMPASVRMDPVAAGRYRMGQQDRMKIALYVHERPETAPAPSKTTTSNSSTSQPIALFAKGRHLPRERMRHSEVGSKPFGAKIVTLDGPQSDYMAMPGLSIPAHKRPITPDTTVGSPPGSPGESRYGEPEPPPPAPEPAPAPDSASFTTKGLSVQTIRRAELGLVTEAHLLEYMRDPADCITQLPPSLPFSGIGSEIPYAMRHCSAGSLSHADVAASSPEGASAAGFLVLGDRLQTPSTSSGASTWAPRARRRVTTWWASERSSIESGAISSLLHSPRPSGRARSPTLLSLPTSSSQRA